MPDPTFRTSDARTGFQPIRIPSEHTLLGAARLISDPSGPKQQAARRMVSAASMHGIDLSLMWGTVDRDQSGRVQSVREVCLAVPGSGRTAIMLLGDPLQSGPMAMTGHPERVACAEAACEYLRTLIQDDRSVRLAQTLPEPKQEWAVRAFSDAGFSKVGDLAYMRRDMRLPGVEPPQSWPAGVEVRNIRGIGPADPDHAALVRALDLSYEDTLDCPELCGLRDTRDVLESHRATGTWNARLWWLVMLDGEPNGCMLLNRIPDQGTVELVYLGLSRRLRGSGLGSRLLSLGIDAASRTDARSMTCAVDLRNTPAQKLYGRFGFKEFGRRVAMVRSIA